MELDDEEDAEDHEEDGREDCKSILRRQITLAT